MAFEQLVAEAAAKKEKTKDKKGKEHTHVKKDTAATEAAADAPNVPKV